MGPIARGRSPREKARVVRADEGVDRRFEVGVGAQLTPRTGPLEDQT